ncbi:uncharacterized protein LOC111156430 [Enhydra lutris kenyoni]|uniref:Uncharacterized protein LOC111156430 n=1 Tax=Enhydra lutris kenyoni TaxID=391180 RepID=A0A2Y9KV32_ENHLU|nr:uncharacterized protein LOC111156430 [Enhydra lutris kenyoni]
MTQSLLFSGSVLAQFCGLSEAGAWLLASQRWVKTLLLPPQKGKQVGRRGSADMCTVEVCAGAGSSEAWSGFCTYLAGNSGGSGPQACARPASAGCVLPLLITDPHRLFQPATFLKGSSQLRSSIRAFLAGTKFSRLASFSCPEEAYFKKLVFVGKFKTYTEVEYYSRIPSTCHATSVVITFANKHDVKARDKVGKALAPMATLPRAEASGLLPHLQPAWVTWRIQSSYLLQLMDSTVCHPPQPRVTA